MEPPARLHRRLRLSTDTEGETVTVRNRVPAAAVSTTTTPAAAASASSTSAPNGVRRSGRTSVPTARIMENRCQETHDRRVSPRIVSRSASPPSTNSRLQPVVDEEEELPLYDDRHDWMSREDYEAQIEPLSKVNNKKNKSIHDEAVLNAFGGDDGSCTDGSDSDGNNLTTWASNNLTAGRPRRRPRVSWKEEMDLALLTVLADVGTGNWPRVLLTAHNMHLLTGVTVCWGVRESSSISLTRSFLQGPAALRRRYNQLRGPKSWLESPPKVPRLNIPRNLPAPEQLQMEQEHAKLVAARRKMWDKCIRLCMKVGVVSSFVVLCDC